MGTDQDIDSDWALLRRFSATGDEAAFRRVVERHAPLVRGVALRCLGDGMLAEEVTQSVFSLVARRAASLPAAHLSGWLYRTAVLTAKNARRAAARYQDALCEMGQHSNLMNQTKNDLSHEHSPWEEVRPHLDQAISVLPEKMRGPLIMRFFENRSIGDIVMHTGRSEAAIRKSIERALRQLGVLLQRQGLTTTGSALGIMLAGQSMMAPPACAASLTAAALQEASSITAVAATTSGGAALISKTIILMTTTQTAALTAAAITLASVPALFLWRENSSLKREVAELKAAAVVHVAEPAGPAKKPAAATIRENRPIKATAGAAAAEPNPVAAALVALFSPEALLKRAEEDAVKNALRDLERISLYLPELDDAQKEAVRAALEGHNKARLAQLKRAFDTGAFERVMNHPETATLADRKLMAEAAPAGLPSREEDPLATVLTADQFDVHWKKQEERRRSEAEAKASDALKMLDEHIGLSAEQKDRIFQGYAQVQLAPVEGGDGLSNSFLDERLREEEKQRILRETLTPEQVQLVEKRFTEFKEGIENLRKAAEGTGSPK